MEKEKYTVKRILKEAFWKIPPKIIALVGFVATLVTLEPQFNSTPIFPKIVNTLCAFLWPSCVLIFLILSYYNLVHNHLKAVQEMTTAHQSNIQELTAKHEKELKDTEKSHAECLEKIQEAHENDMLDLGTQLLERIPEAQVVDYRRYESLEELTAVSMYNAAISQLVSIRIDIRWDDPSYKKTIGYGIVEDTGEKYTIVKIIEKKETFKAEWELICDKNKTNHKEQLTHTTISGIVTVDERGRFS